jgi:hypothetical protein
MMPEVPAIVNRLYKAIDAGWLEFLAAFGEPEPGECVVCFVDSNRTGPHLINAGGQKWSILSTAKAAEIVKTLGEADDIGQNILSVRYPSIPILAIHRDGFVLTIAHPTGQPN